MRQSNPENNVKIRKNFEDLKALLKPEDSLLDVGCYLGYLSEWLGHEKYIGMDLIPEYVDKAKELHLGRKFVCGDLF